MRDINFFRPYIKGDKNEDSKRYYLILAVFVGAIIIITYSINIAKTIIYNKEIKNYEAQLNKDDVKEKLETSENISKQLEVLKNYDKDLTLAINSISKNNLVSTEILGLINGVIPKNIDLKTMNISGNVISIGGISTSRQAVAEMEHNLSSIKKIKKVYVYNIAEDKVEGESEDVLHDKPVESSYAFTMNCYLNGGDNQNEFK